MITEQTRRFAAVVSHMPLFSRSRSKSSEQAAPAAGGGAGVSVSGGGRASSADDSEMEVDGSPHKEARTLSTTSIPADEGGGE